MTDDERPSWDERAEQIDPDGFGPMHFDRQGNPISLRRWAELRETPGYIIVGRTRISDFSELSTVWLGIDHGFFSSFQPIIFESMYFIEHDPVTHKGELMGTNWEYTSEREGFLLARYSTEEQALAGHDQLIEACKDGSWKEL
jgi:hypothetical protein